MSDGFIRDYGPAIAWIIVFVGWFVTNRQANQREKRKEIRADVDRITGMIRQLVDDHRLYFTAPVGSPEEIRNGVAIKASFQRISMALERQTGRIECAESKAHFVQLYELMTGGDFEDTSRKVRNQSDHSFVTAASFAERTINAIERGFLAKFS
jgi:hypothetical protein